MPPSSITLALVSPLALTLHDARLRAKKSITAAGLLRGGQQINVANDFLAPAQTAGGAATHHVRMLAQAVQDRLGGAAGRRKEMAGGVLTAEIDPCEDVGLRFFAKAGQFRHLSF